MSPTETPQRIVVYLTGVTPGPVLPAFAASLTGGPARLVRLFQTRLDQGVVIGAVIDCDDRTEVESTLRRFAAERGLHLDLQASFDRPEPLGEPFRVCVTLLGALGDAQALAQVTRRLVEADFVVDEARSLGRDALVGVELVASRPSALEPPRYAALRAALLRQGPALGIDIAVQLDDFYRRGKRLLCMDVDSTFVKGEFIDELAELCGVKPQVSDITARAMRGELDFQGALRERVRLLRGLPMARAKELCDRFELSPGAGELVQTVRRLGMRVGLVSGGFTFFVEMLRDRFGLDFAFANELEVKDGVLTGEVVGAIVDGQRKAQLLRDMAHVFSVKLEQTIAVGDGANDIQMLETAGLGIAYQAKPKLKEVADLSFDHHTRLDTLLYLMGFDAVEARAALE
jgi:phosphoserine phosphatase